MRTMILLASLLASPLAAHEFWIEPIRTEIAAGGRLEADIRVGTDLKGSTYSYIPRNFRRFETILDGTRAVPGRAGDQPALNMEAAGEGLAVIVHETRDYLLTYAKWEKFEAFCAEKDFEWALPRHLERGLPRTKFRERYVRYAKSLIGVGDAKGADTEAGLTVEIVAEKNPYTDDVSGGFPVQALYLGQPRKDVQITLFERAPDRTVVQNNYRTDGEGRAVLDVKAGHFYLVDHVVMRESEPMDEKDAVWESLWASLTFGVPQ
ncbi:DUF4198 domain-containing protein [Pacificoceanicola onchidii]|uniref:DUF4198 domain-containing protein n=1 Tax=Pacificoceanicola onchidii TaxID=2562685 RepID=UPI0010A3EF8E|nr:DUF4198 domain-containing protein [Pacificoceanicola onchidii]